MEQDYISLESPSESEVSGSSQLLPLVCWISPPSFSSSSVARVQDGALLACYRLCGDKGDSRDTGQVATSVLPLHGAGKDPPFWMRGASTQDWDFSSLAGPERGGQVSVDALVPLFCTDLAPLWDTVWVDVKVSSHLAAH